MKQNKLWIINYICPITKNCKIPKWFQADGHHVYVYGFKDLVRWFSKTNIFGMVTEKERRRYVHIRMNGHVFFLKHPKKLFEAKLVVCEI